MVKQWSRIIVLTNPPLIFTVRDFGKQKAKTSVFSFWSTPLNNAYQHTQTEMCTADRKWAIFGTVLQYTDTKGCHWTKQFPQTRSHDLFELCHTGHNVEDTRESLAHVNVSTNHLLSLSKKCSKRSEMIQTELSPFF